MKGLTSIGKFSAVSFSDTMLSHRGKQLPTTTIRSVRVLQVSCLWIAKFISTYLRAGFYEFT